jgi:hypothetical protein
MSSMAQPARAPQSASNKGMVGTKLATEYWAVVEDCLVQFHGFKRSDAAAKVTSLQKRLAQISTEIMLSDFDDMIYHEEPWYIACNLADKDMPLKPHRTEYEAILKQNHLA